MLQKWSSLLLNTLCITSLKIEINWTSHLVPHLYVLSVFDSDERLSDFSTNKYNLSHFQLENQQKCETAFNSSPQTSPEVCLTENLRSILMDTFINTPCHCCLNVFFFLIIIIELLEHFCVIRFSSACFQLYQTTLFGFNEPTVLVKMGTLWRFDAHILVNVRIWNRLNIRTSSVKVKNAAGKGWKVSLSIWFVDLMKNWFDVGINN